MRDRRPSALWIALLVVLLLVNLPQFASLRVKAVCREAIVPFQHLLAAVADRARAGFAALIRPGDTVSDVERLGGEVDELREQVRALERLRKENGELREALGFVRRSARDMVACEVIARGDTSGYWETVRLNKGSAAGLAVDLPVVTHRGLVGKTVAVSEHTCEALLITDRNCRAAAKLSRTGDFGIVEGRGASIAGRDVLDMQCPFPPCAMEYVARNVQIKEGDEAVTSGLGGLYPEGILIGRVKSVEVHRSGLYQIAQVAPSADLYRLNHVFVIRRSDRRSRDGSP